MLRCRALSLTLFCAPLAIAACSPPGGAVAGRHPTPAPGASAVPVATPTASPSAVAYPPYYIESLRQGSYGGGRIEVGSLMFRGSGFTKSHVTWGSQGQVMTGTISIPDGAGPFPVVVVNHGHIPVSRYWIGQDSGIFGDPMAAHGFISIAPNYPGYSGSGTLDPRLPAIVAQAVADLDLIAELNSLPQADPSRVALAGHSNGGGVSMLVAAATTRVRVEALFAPVSSDMTDNARKWWSSPDARGGLPPPDQPGTAEAYAHVSPRTYFTAASPPAILLQGTADQDIPAAWTNATAQALREQGVDVAQQWYPGAAHDLVGADLADAVARAEAFIRGHLG